PGRDPDVVLPRHALGVHFGASDEVVDILRLHGDALDLPPSDPARDLAPELADLALQLAHARLARVAGDDLALAFVRDRQLPRSQPVLVRLPRQEVAPRDCEFFA